MEKIYIVCIEDQREVLNVVSEHLSHFEDVLSLEECESTSEAKELFEEIDDSGDYIGVIISDHVMPNQTGVDFLIEINNWVRYKVSQSNQFF